MSKLEFIPRPGLDVSWEVTTVKTISLHASESSFFTGWTEIEHPDFRRGGGSEIVSQPTMCQLAIINTFAGSSEITPIMF